MSCSHLMSSLLHMGHHGHRRYCLVIDGTSLPSLIHIMSRFAALAIL